ncbi:Transcriptional regulator PadR-like family protein [compost metagenome]
MSLQIFILGILSEGEHHPYDLKKQVLKPIDNSFPINDGTLYYNFEILNKKGLIRKIKVVQSDNRPEKTTYGITEKGREALVEEIYSIFQNFTNVTSLYSSLLFLDKVDHKKLAYLIEEAIERLNKRKLLIENSDPELSTVPDSQKIPVRLISDHAYHSVQNDINWLHKLLLEVRS